MSEHQLFRRNSMHSQDDNENKNITLVAYEAHKVDEQRIEDTLRRIYSPVDRRMCEDYQPPNMAPIQQRKNQLGKEFDPQVDRNENIQHSSSDGLYSTEDTGDEEAGLVRLKTRLVRDGRQAYWEENSSFIIERQLLSKELSKVANISYEEEMCLGRLQKNAILSERNNQKKQIPSQMDFYIGGLWFNRHPLQNDEEVKFEELRVSLKKWARLAAHPALPQLQKQIEYLQRLREEVGQHHVEIIEDKIRLLTREHDLIKLETERLMKNIVQSHEELREIRRKTGMDTVPWKVMVKEYEVKGKTCYDIGVIPFQSNDKAVGADIPDAQKQEERRQEIRSEKYYVRVWANGNQISRSEKKKLLWPQYRVLFSHRFTILVYTSPATLKVEVYKCGFIDSLVDTLYVSVPGEKAESLTASEKRYGQTYFATNRGKEAQEKKDDKKRNVTSGVLLHQVEWVGKGKMPTMATKTAEEETQATDLPEGDLREEQKADYEELFDIMDPRKHHDDVRKQAEREIQEEGNAKLPFYDIIPRRHLLLKLKNQLPQLQKVQIPLREEEILMREDLLQIIEQEQRTLHVKQAAANEYFNPTEDIFADQPQIVLKDILHIIAKIKNLKALTNRSSTGGGPRYKITEEMVEEYIFEQMQSPIVIFFKNLFTQKRKLGPEVTHRVQAKSKIDQLEINLHVRSARNVPIREASFDRIKQFQEEENKFKIKQQQLANFQTGAAYDRLGGYGQGFYKQQPQVNMHGNTFFNAHANQGGRNHEISYEHLDLDRVSGYVELRVKKKVKATRTFQGPFPEWNETLNIKYSMKQEQTTLDKILLGAEKSIRVLVFDMKEESRATQAVSQARVKKIKYYLGRIEVPFSFLITVPSSSGLYRIQRPLVTYGYGVRKAGLFDFQNEEEQSKTQNPDIYTYLNLDLFSEPLIDSSLAYNEDRKYVQGAGQNPLLLQRSTDWLDQLNTKRYVRLWLNSTEGKSVFICRYLSDNITPPRLVNDGSAGSFIERCARFVSLIPRKWDCKMLEGTEEFHLRCDQFLNLKMGEDHGILLCNYFNYVDRSQGRRDVVESSLLICKAFPYGKCIFVLRRDIENKHAEIWDPFTGQCYFMPARQYETFFCCIKYEKVLQNGDARSRDICPIIEASCIVTRNNVYFNKQESVKPASMNFDLEDESCWKPFLNQRTAPEFLDNGNTMKSIQHAIPPAFYPDLQNLQSPLEARLNREIRDRFSHERINQHRPLTFKVNDRISNLINNRLLPLCERFKVDYRFSGTESTLYSPTSRQQYVQALQRLQDQRDKIKDEVPHQKQLFGFTLNTTFTTVPDFLQHITQTQIQLQQTEDMQFVVAVQCSQYPCHLVSVWVFLGTIR